MAERVLSRRELNRALLARQLLLERGTVTLPKALERIAGIQAQYAPAMYIGLWSRLRGFRREALTRALERRSVVQGTLLRSTIHLVSARDWWTWAEAVRETRREGWLRYHRGEPSAEQMASAARRVRPLLAQGPLPRKQLAEEVGFGSVGINGLNLWLDLVRVPPSGTWERRRADLFGAADDWLGEPPALDAETARAELVGSYLRGFGPATAAQIASWAGLSVGAVGRALAQLELRRFRAEDGSELLDLPRLPLPDPATPAPPRFLPVWDATLLAHGRRSQILPEEYRPRVFNTKTPQSVNTFLVDGAVAGAWRFEGGGVVTEPFARLDSAVRRELADEAERLAAFGR